MKMSGHTLHLQPAIVHWTLPINLKKADRHLFEHDIEAAFPAVSEHALGTGFIRKLKCDGYSRSGNRIRRGFIPRMARIARVALSNKDQPIAGGSKNYWVSSGWSGNYFHWITDTLPKLELIEETLNSEDVKIIVPRRLLANGSFQYRTLKHYNIPFLDVGDVTIVQNAVHLPNLSPTGNPRVEFISRIKNRLRVGTNAGPGKGRRIITIRPGLKRAMANREEVIAAVQDLGFEPIDWEVHSFEEQAEIAASCEVMIGPHGANLTNAMFMDPGKLCIEIRSDIAGSNNCYFALSHAADLQYGYSLHPLNSEGAFLVNPRRLRQDVIKLLDSTKLQT